MSRPTIALVLTGGGARAAYQIGVLRAIRRWMPRHSPLPFRVVCGTSAGAINAAALAAGADDFQGSVAMLERVWGHFHAGQVYRVEPWRAGFQMLRWMATLMLGAGKRWAPRALLDPTPLRRMVERELDLSRVQQQIDQGYLDALAVTATAYHGRGSVTFFQGHDRLEGWRRQRRNGLPRPITVDHLMASASIPFLFPAVRLGYEFYGDGALRQLAPLSAGLHLGADRVLVIGVRPESESERVVPMTPPTLGQVAGYLLDAVFMDATATDLERLKRVNHTVSLLPPTGVERTALRQVRVEGLFPSQDPARLVGGHIDELPATMRVMLKRLGALNPEGHALASYLLFEAGYCRALMDQGERDANRAQTRLTSLLDGHLSGR